MAESLKIYPSGFLGSVSVEQTKPIDMITAAKQLFNTGLSSKLSQYLANQEVCELWADIIGGAEDYKTFEFKERILKCALSAFGTDKLVDWIGSQIESPDFTDYHFRWIDETILFVFENKPRQISNNNWISLLKVGGTDSNDYQFSPIVRYYLLGEKMIDRKELAPYRANITITDFICEWVRKDKGIEDLATSLNTLFGAR
jgi:hypothetical protein